MFDLRDLASYAFRRNDYPIAADLCRRLFHLMPNDYSKNVLYEWKKQLKNLATKIASYNNAYLEKYQCFASNNHRMMTYTVNKKLEPFAKQPEYVNSQKVYQLPNLTGKIVSEWMLAQTCQKGFFVEKRIDFQGICRYLHHNDPYLKLGPFLEEQVSKIPYSVIIHNFLNEAEIQYLIDEARPGLSNQRSYVTNSGAINYNEINSGKVRRFVSKTVQTWLSEAEWPPLVKFEDWVGKRYIKILSPLLWRLNKKISLATQMVTNTHWSTTNYQITNYGLGGLCESHIDPVGILEQDENHTKMNMPNLLIHGDILGTVMAWLSNTEAGGGTSYLSPGYEGVILPERGAIAFWYDLTSDGRRDIHSTHGGCPVLKGSKWIMNKWIHMYDNFKRFRCKLRQKLPFDIPGVENYF